MRLSSLYEGAGAVGADELVGPLLKAPDRPDAIVVAATRFAIGVAEAAEGAGLRMPEEPDPPRRQETVRPEIRWRDTTR